MKNNGKCRKITAAVLTLILAALCLCAQAESDSSAPAARSETVAELLKVIDFKFFVKENGIGTGSAPVYTAPSEDSLRLADGKASCSVESEIAVAGYEDRWLMVRYEIGKKEEKDKQARVGYIPPKYSKGYKTGRGKITFSRVPVQLAADTEITDNPRHNSTPFGTLPAGTDITILGKYTYTGNWWYIEAELDGKLARGFIDRSEAEILADGTVYHGNLELGFPVTSPENTRQTGTVTVNGTADDAMIVRQDAGADSRMVARVYGGESFPCYGSREVRHGRIWYYIWVDGVWGWFSGGNSTYTESE